MSGTIATYAPDHLRGARGVYGGNPYGISLPLSSPPFNVERRTEKNTSPPQRAQSAAKSGTRRIRWLCSTPFIMTKRAKNVHATRAKLHREDPNCHWCRRPLDLSLAPWKSDLPLPPNYPTIEHIIPIASGGANRIENMALACPSCNGSRSFGAPSKWRRKALKRSYVNRVKLADFWPDGPSWS